MPPTNPKTPKPKTPATSDTSKTPLPSPHDMDPPPGSLQRTESTDTLSSVTDYCPITAMEYTNACRVLIVTLKNNKAFPKALREYTTEISRRLKYIEKWQHQNKMEQTQTDLQLQEQISKANDYREMLKHYTDNVPKTDAVERAISRGLSAQLEQMQQNIEEKLQHQFRQFETLAMDHLKASVLAPVPVDTPAPDQHHAEQTPVGATQFAPNPQPPNDNQTFKNRDIPPERRTIVVMSKNQTPGRDILPIIAALKPPGGLIECARPYRYSLHITFRSLKEKENFKRFLQQHQRINRIFDILDLPIEKLKILLTGIPKDQDKDYVTSSIIEYHDLIQGDLQIISTYENKRGSSNFVAVAPIDVARYLVEAGGAFVGPIDVQIFPYTSMPRCRNCQRIGHLTNKCTAPPHCPKCGDAHDLEDDNIEKCNNPVHCVNCAHLNRQLNCDSSTTHPATDKNCAAYKYFYNQERQLTNERFGIKERPQRPQNTNRNPTTRTNPTSNNEPQPEESSTNKTIPRNEREHQSRITDRTTPSPAAPHNHNEIPPWFYNLTPMDFHRLYMMRNDAPTKDSRIPPWMAYGNPNNF